MQRWTSICKPHTYTNMHKTIYMQTCTMWWLVHLSSSYSKTFKVISPWKMMGKLWFRCGRALAFCWQSKICGTLVCGSLLHVLLFIHWSIYQVLTYKLKWKKNEKCPLQTLFVLFMLYILSLMGFLHFSLSWRTLLSVPSLFQWFCELHRNTCAQIENPSLYSLCRQIPLLYYKVSITWPARVHSRSLIDHYTAACWFFQVTFMVAQRRGV